MDTLDIRDFKETGAELVTAISNAVAGTQRVIIQRLPDKIVMTRVQYEQLEHDPDMQAFDGRTERIFLTPHNAMDVIVKE